MHEQRVRDGAKEALVYDASLYKHSWSDDTDNRTLFPVTPDSPRNTLSSLLSHTAHLQVIKPPFPPSIHAFLLSFIHRVFSLSLSFLKACAMLRLGLWAPFICGLIAGDNSNDDNECGFVWVCARVLLSVCECVPKNSVLWLCLVGDFI